MSRSINPFGFIYQETDISSAHLFGFIAPPPLPPVLPFFVPCSGWSPLRGDRAYLVGFRGEDAACLLLGTIPPPPPQFPIITFPHVKTAVITLAWLTALPAHPKHTLHTERAQVGLWASSTWSCSSPHRQHHRAQETN